MREAVEAFKTAHERAGDPSWDAFEIFMATLPLEQQFAIVRFMGAHSIDTRHPSWLVFALMGTAVEKFERAFANIDAPLDAARQALMQQIQNICSPEGEIGTAFKNQCEILQRGIETHARLLHNTSVASTNFASATLKASNDYADAVNKAAALAIANAGAALSRSVFNLKVWSVATVVAVGIALGAGEWAGLQASRTNLPAFASRARLEQLRNMLHDPNARSPQIQRYLLVRLKNG